MRFHKTAPCAIAHGFLVAQLSAECPYILQFAAPSPSKLPFPMGDLDLDLTRRSVNPFESSTQTASQSAGLTLWQTDRPTDHPTDQACYSAASTCVVL